MAAAIVLSLIGPVIELGKCIYDPLKRQCGFLLCYKKEVHVLRKEANSLCTDRQSPLKKVEEWKSNVDRLVREVEELEMQLKEESTCLNGWCPNLSWRYRLGKSAATKVDEVKELKKEYEGFGDSLTHLPRQPDIELIRRDPMQQNEVAMTIMNDVMQALRDDNIRSIGIHGMGGIGKTTLVDNINNKLVGTQLFDKVIKETVSQNVDVKAIQHTIAKRLELNLDGDATINARANDLVQRLKNEQRVLIILDDVWSKLEIVDIGIPSEDEHKNCKIIVTTRNQNVCRQMGLQKEFAMKLLSGPNSWALFAQKIGDVVSKNPKLLSIAKDIVGECNGSPLAIVTIGSTLRQEENEIIWRDALRRLKSSEPTELEGIMPQVITSIKFSYDYIKDEEMKFCFLFCCLFPEDYNINLSELRRYIIGEGFLKVDGNLLQSQEKLEANIIKLKGCNLLLDGYKGQVKIHDVVRDTAICIGRKNGQGFVVKIGVGLTDWPQLEEENNVQRISLMKNEIRRLSILPKLPQLRTLLFEVPSSKSQLEYIEDNFFEGMKALVNLNLGSTKLSRLPSSISCLTNLRTLVLKNLDGELDVSIIGELKRLEILELKGCNFPIEFGELTNLRVLHMYIPLGSIPANVISKLVHLEELHLYSISKSTNEGDEENISILMGSMASLRELELDGSMSTKQFLNTRDFKLMGFSEWPHDAFGRVERLILKRLSNLEKICEGPLPYGFLRNLKNLTILNCIKLKGIFPWGLALETVQSVWIKGMTGGEVFCDLSSHLIPPNALGTLEILFLSSIEQMKKVFHESCPTHPLDSIDGRVLYNLHEISLLGLPNLRCLCSFGIALRFLPNLSYLNISHCEKLETVIAKENEDETVLAIQNSLPMLNRIDLVHLPKLTGLYSGNGVLHLPSLETILVCNCIKLMQLSLEPDSCPKLRQIKGGKKWIQALEQEMQEEIVRSRFQALFVVDPGIEKIESYESDNFETTEEVEELESDESDYFYRRGK